MEKSFSVIEYIRLGGFKNIAPYSAFTKTDFYQLITENEIWETEHCTVFRVSSNCWIDTYITFDMQGEYISDTMEISIEILWKPLQKIPKEYLYRYSEKSLYLLDDDIIKEVFDDNERVIFLKNGTDLHFLKSNMIDDYLLVKVVSNSKYREAIKKIFK